MTMLQHGTHSSVLLEGTASLCVDDRKSVDMACMQRYLAARDSYRASDKLNPRNPRWEGTSMVFAASVWQTSGDSMSTRAFKTRLAWDKHYTGRHKNFGREYDLEIQCCPLCGTAAETQDHILRHCSHPDIVAARLPALKHQGGRLRECYLKDPTTARYLDDYHTLCLTHEDGGSMMTGMLTPTALERVSSIPCRGLNTNALYWSMVRFCRGYRDMSMEIFRVRAQLLAAKDAPERVKRHRARMPSGQRSHLRRNIRPMTSTRTDYPGLPDEGCWRSDSNSQHDIREYFGASPACVASSDRSASTSLIGRRHLESQATGSCKRSRRDSALAPTRIAVPNEHPNCQESDHHPGRLTPVETGIVLPPPCKQSVNVQRRNKTACSYLLHGLSSSGTLALTLDLRHYLGNGRPIAVGDEGEYIRFLADAREANSVAGITNLILSARHRCFHFSVPLNDEHYGDTPDNGLCGYILAVQLHTRAMPLESPFRASDQ